MKTLIISDFSKTFTAPTSKTTWSLFKESGLFPEEYSKRRDELFEVYRPYEIAGDNAKVREWFQKHLELLAEYDAVVVGEGEQVALDLLTTNETYFFREPQHFAFLSEPVLPHVPVGEPFRVWSAACSSGEEPYTLAMTLAEALGSTSRDVKILATDISTKVLAEGEQGIYSEDTVSPVPQIYLKKYFLKGHNEWQGYYSVKDELKQWVHFRRLNLMEPFPLSIEFDYVFVRNVMIYFDKETRESLVNRMEKHLKVGGYLFIGNAESLSGLKHNYKYIQPAVYQRV